MILYWGSIFKSMQMRYQQILSWLKNRLEWAPIYKLRRQDGSEAEFLAAKRGNYAYAWRQEEAIQAKKSNLLAPAPDKSMLFITLIVPYAPTLDGCKKCWLDMNNALTPFIRKLKKLGAVKYLVVLEAMVTGGCHAHIMVRWANPLRIRWRKKECFLNDRVLSKQIKDSWQKFLRVIPPLVFHKNAINIRVCSNRSEEFKTFCYITKFLGKNSAIETALDLAKQGDLSDYNIKKLFSCYWATLLRIRLFRASRGLGLT